MLILEDSHLGSRLRLRALGGTLSVDCPAGGPRCESLMLQILDEAGRERFKETYPAPGLVRCDPPLNVSGAYFLRIYGKPPGVRLYYSLLGGRVGVPLWSDGRTVSLRASPFILSNRDFLRSLPTSGPFLRRSLEDTEDIQSGDRTVRDLSRELSRGSLFPLSTIVKAYRWVAGNIAYDYDSLRSGRYRDEDFTALDMLRRRRGVCCGYHNLLAALLRASGIPAIGIDCCALGVGTNGWWYQGKNLDMKPNHVITAAFGGQRWHVMDVTWGSDLVYERGVRSRSGRLGPTLSFCDVTLPFLSLSHRLDKVAM